MKHPTTPCPEHLRPILGDALKEIRHRIRRKGATYICLIIEEMPITIFAERQAAIRFISNCLDDNHSFGGWLIDNDPVYRKMIEIERTIESANYEAQCRVAWLEFLVNG